MKTTAKKKPVAIVLIVSLALSCCGGCSNGSSADGGELKLSPIYKSALWGALIGGIIGYQSEEAGEGAALGAIIFGVGELLKQSDKLPHKERRHEDRDEEPEKVVIEIHNANSSVTCVSRQTKCQ